MSAKAQKSNDTAVTEHAPLAETEPDADPPEDSLAEEAPEGEASPISRWLPWIVVGGVALVMLALQLYRVREPVAGYHSFNEGYYTDLAFRYLKRGWFSPLTSPLDTNNPPFYSLVLSWVFGVFGPSPTTGRLLSIAATAGTIPLVYLLGRRLFSRRVGMMAAVFFALTPAVVLVGRNVQVDAVLVLLMTAGMLAYVRSVDDEDIRYAALAGLLLGLAVLTKLPAVLAVAALALWRTLDTRGVRWIWTRASAVAIGAFVVGGAWWPLYRYLAAPEYRAAQSAISSAARGPSDASWIITYLFGRELLWAMFPPVAVIALLCLAPLLANHRKGDLFVLSGLAAVLTWLWFFHFHTYYALPLFPLTALLLARGLQLLTGRSWRASAVVTAVLALGLLLGSTVMLSQKEWGTWASAYIDGQVASITDADPALVTLHVDERIDGNSFGPAFFGTPMRTHLVHEPLKAGEKPAPGTRQLYLGYRDDPRFGAPLVAAGEVMVSPVVFGRAIRFVRPWPHMFTNAQWHAEKAGPPWRFGVSTIVVDTYFFRYYER